MATQRLQILSTVNYFARLRVLAHNVIMIDFVFPNLVTRSGGRPMSTDRRANVVLVHLFEKAFGV